MDMNKALHLYEELMLLALKDKEGTFAHDDMSFAYTLGGALLSELLLLEKIRIGDTFTDAEFADLIAAAYRGFGHAARAPLKQLGPNHFLLELFHGPTLAFKDFAMQLIGQLFQVALKRRGERVTIVHD